MFNAYTSLSVRFRTSILCGGVIVREMPAFTRNLILDAGLEMPASYPFAGLSQFLALGTGTKPTKRDSGAVTFSRSGNVVTASAAFFVVADVGRLLKLDTGAEFYVSQYNSSTEVLSVTSGSNASSEGTVWYVNETGHEAEFARFSTCASETGDCGSTFLSGVWTHKRTFLSSVFAEGKLIQEVGWAPASSGGLYGRAIVPGGGDFVAAGQQYKVVVEALSSWGPSTAQTQANIGNNGFSTAGQFALEYVPECGVNSDGSYDRYWNYYGGLRYLAVGGGRVYACLGTSAAPLTPLCSGEKRGPPLGLYDVCRGFPLDIQGYVSGSRVSRWRGTLGVSEANSSLIRSISCVGDSNNVFQAGRVLLDAPQTKDADHTLTIGFSFGWGRVLVN